MKKRRCGTTTHDWTARSSVVACNVIGIRSLSAFSLKAIEGLFAKQTKRKLKRGVFCSIVEPQAAISRFLAETNKAVQR